MITDKMRFKLHQVLIVFSIILSILPAVYLSSYLFRTGTNVVSSDDARYTTLIPDVLAGSYSWKNYIKDTFQANGHSNAVPVLIQILDAYLFSWNIYWILLFGILLAVIRVLLLYSAFTHLNKDPIQWILLPILSALIFLPTQVSVFEHDLATLQINFNQLGFVLGLWGLVRYSGQWRGIIVMLFGGLVSCLSYGTGPFGYLCFLLGMVILNYRKISHYLAWAVGGVVATSPFFYFLIFNQNLASNVHMDLSHVSWAKLLKFVLSGMGWTFFPHFPQWIPARAGVVGILLVLVFFGILLRTKKSLIVKAAPGILLIAFGAISILEIALFRNQFTIWYTSLFLPFWLGILDFGYVAWANRRELGNKKYGGKVSIIFSGLVLLSFCFFYLASGLRIFPYSAFLQTRAPVTASCVRHYEMAPTYCEKTPFVWGEGAYQFFINQFVLPLAKSKLSVFSGHQNWSLQGDFIFPSVTVFEHPQVLPISWWLPGLKNQPVSFFDGRHLNLFLHSPNYVDWKLKLPSNLKKAEFHSAVMISPSIRRDTREDGIVSQVTMLRKDQEPLILFSHESFPKVHKWVPFSIPLSSFKGQEVTLRLETKPLGNFIHDWALYQYPYIDMVLENADNSYVKTVIPANTDASPFFPMSSTEDFLLDKLELWKSEGMTSEKTSESTFRIKASGVESKLITKDELNLCLKDYSFLVFSISVPQDISPRAIKLELAIQGEKSYSRQIIVPLLADGLMHRYSYDLKVLEVESKAILKGVSYFPVLKSPVGQGALIEIGELRLIKKPAAASFCSK